MEQIRAAVITFLKKHAMDYEDIDMEQTSRLFLDEMEKGLHGKDSSLQMIPTYMETDRTVPLNKPVIVMDAGGTNFRVATVYFDKKAGAVIENFTTYPMPGSKQHVGKVEFFDIITQYIEPLLDTAPSIGFCFSYPTEIMPSKDGRLIRFSKEMKAPEVVGQMIGENLILAIRSRRRNHNKHIVLLNDTVATLLAGRSGSQDRVFDTYVGFILGTGTNCCYIEKNAGITKKKDLDPAKTQIINVESGSFAKAPRGNIDLQFDHTTLDEGMSTFEKMISGAYLGPLCIETARTAAGEGLFSPAAISALNKIMSIDTKDINDFMYFPRGNNLLGSALAQADQKDIVTLYCLIDRLVERAAKLTAVNLSAMVLKSGKGVNPCAPVCIVAEGSTFYGLKSLRSRVEFYLKKYLEDCRHRYYDIINVENATLIGAAIAGLTN